MRTLYLNFALGFLSGITLIIGPYFLAQRLAQPLRPAVDFYFPGSDGEHHSLSEHRGELVLLVFENPQTAHAEERRQAILQVAAHLKDRQVPAQIYLLGDRLEGITTLLPDQNSLLDLARSYEAAQGNSVLPCLIMITPSGYWQTTFWPPYHPTKILLAIHILVSPIGQ